MKYMYLLFVYLYIIIYVIILKIIKIILYNIYVLHFPMEYLL